jgi:hypothetical protein
MRSPVRTPLRWDRVRVSKTTTAGSTAQKLRIRLDPNNGDALDFCLDECSSSAAFTEPGTRKLADCPANEVSINLTTTLNARSVRRLCPMIITTKAKHFFAESR